MPNFPQPCKAVDFRLGYSCLGFMGLAGTNTPSYCSKDLESWGKIYQKSQTC